MFIVKTLLPKTLGYQTDFILHQLEGEISETEHYYRILTPSNPNFHYGNYLVFKSPPGLETYLAWRRAFQQEVASGYTRIHHELYGWDSDDLGDPSAFLDVGFRLDYCTVMTLHKLTENFATPEGISLRALQTEADYEQTIELQTRISIENGYEEEGSKTYLRQKMSSYRSMIEAGHGQWFGAFRGEELAATMGLFWNTTVGRYQEVATAPEHRRQGLARTLTHFVADYGLRHGKLKTLVIVADINYHAKTLYESVGFRHGGYQYALYWHSEMPELRD